VPILEETGLITAVGEWVVRGACAQIETWRASGVSPVPVAINLSTRQLRNPGFAELIARTLAAHGVAAGLLQVEITESSLMENPEEADRTLAQLKALGVQLAIDDFGTGYSSLGYLKRFSFDTLKIDRSFVRGISIDAGDATIARTIIALGHNLGLSVVAEGVETSEQLAFLRSNHCDYAQGFLFSTAVGSDDATRLLTREATFLTGQGRLPERATLRRK
jgi:EAL domain-containing protein (putative c-di-GMP-specific phosphodiesterase class I)